MRRETRTKAVVPTSLYNVTADSVASQRQDGALGRTVLPLSWFLPGAAWDLVLARRWRWPMAIHLAEARAGVIWQRILLLTGLELGRSRSLNVGDNIACVCSLVKGRAHDFFLNGEMRRRACYEAISDCLQCASWTDTKHQPADAGTRPGRDGRLPLARPLWVHARLFVEIFSGSARLTSAARQCDAFANRVSQPWDVLNGPEFDLSDKSNL